jgi:GTP 3',8-cyclase
MIIKAEPATILDRDGRSHRFPPPLERDYPVEQGRVVTRSLESHIVDHCNLTCAECCSLSPLLPPRFTTPEALERDLALAAEVVAPRVFKLVGGEPLLHPELVDMLAVARRSAIAPTLSLTTNGLLLGKLPDAFWEQLDALTISRYPSPVLSEGLVTLVEQKAARFGVRVNWKTQDRFVVMSLPAPREDHAETAAVYERCWLRERCHLVHDGRFYTCTRPMHFHGLLGDREDFAEDGFAMEGGSERLEGLLAYLRREPPLAACAHCAGGDAPMAPHRLLTPAELKPLRRRSSLPLVPRDA